MSALTTIAWAVFAAVIAWGITMWRASAAITRHESGWRRELRRSLDDVARARARVAQLEQDAATWAAGCKQGRDDMITAVPLIIAAQGQRPAHPKPPSAHYPRPGAGQYTRPGAAEYARPDTGPGTAHYIKPGPEHYIKPGAAQYTGPVPEHYIKPRLAAASTTEVT